jgi:hypothetical protein
MSTSSRRYFYRVVTLVVLCLAAMLVTALLAHTLSQIAAAQQRRTPSTIPRLPAPFTAIYTDSYEPDNTQSTAYFAGNYTVKPCQPQSPLLIVWNATFWYGGLANPADDVDWYRLQLGSHLLYTFSITRQVPSDLLFDVNLFGPTGNMIQAWRGGVNPVMTLFSRDGGMYYLQLTATNAATITGTQTKPYMIGLCSSLPLTRQVILPVVYGSASFPPPYSQVVRFVPRDNIGDVPLGYGGEAKSSLLVWEVNGAKSLELEITAMHVGGIFQNCPAGDLASVSPQDAVGRRKPLAVPSGSYPFSITGAGYYLFTIYVTKTDGSTTSIPRNVIVDCYRMPI